MVLATFHRKPHCWPLHLTLSFWPSGFQPFYVLQSKGKKPIVLYSSHSPHPLQTLKNSENAERILLCSDINPNLRFSEFVLSIFWKKAEGTVNGGWDPTECTRDWIVSWPIISCQSSSIDSFSSITYTRCYSIYANAFVTC